MTFDYDVVIIGGGPTGSTLANYLLDEGLSVCIIEKKKRIGYPLQCAGILSHHIFELNELPDDIILNRVEGAFLHTKNQMLHIRKDEPVAYIIDRVAYDNFLFSKAVDNGVHTINQKAVDFDLDAGEVYLQNDETVKSRIIVGCDGYNSILSNKMGNVQSNFHATQMLVEIDDENILRYRNSTEQSNNFVDAGMLEEISPGFFWIIPTGNSLYRVGLFSGETHRSQNEFLEDFLDENFEYETVEKYKGFIPIFSERNLMAKSRAILVGDAAAQVKPTSGGGLLIGFDACQMASKWICRALSEDDVGLLKEYQKEFNRKYSKEFSYQFKVQKTLKMFSDDDLDYLFLKLRENDGEAIVSKYGDMDTQSTLVKEVIKSGLIFKIVPSFLFKKVFKIFGLR